jgi:hypothetical protein
MAQIWKFDCKEGTKIQPLREGQCKLIAHPHLLVQATSERFLPAWSTFTHGLANERHWLQPVLILTVHWWPHMSKCGWAMRGNREIMFIWGMTFHVTTKLLWFTISGVGGNYGHQVSERLVLSGLFFFNGPPRFDRWVIWWGSRSKHHKETSSKEILDCFFHY